MRELGIVMGLMMAAGGVVACPVAGDLDKGIRFAVDSVDSEVYRRTGPGVVEATYSAEDGYVSRTLLGQGIYLLEIVDIVEGVADAGTRTTYAFPGRAEELKLPVPGEQVVYNIVVNNNGDFAQEEQTYDFGPKSLINFGSCEYEMIPIEIRYAPDDDGVVDLLYYLPALGFSYYAGSDFADGTSDRYVYSNMEVVQ